MYASPETRRTDIAIHLQPRDTGHTLESLENRIEDLEADHEYLADKRRAGARGVLKDLEDYREMYDVLRNTSMRAFDTSMVLTVRGNERTVYSSVEPGAADATAAINGARTIVEGAVGEGVGQD